jgi:BolA family transcriptional regulator, general stress-responsive regulator
MEQSMAERYPMASLAETLICEALCPTKIQVIDNSAQHAGHHEGGKTEGTHLHVIVAAEGLNGLSKVSQHRKINHILAPCFERGLHSLQISVHSI